MLSDEDDVEKKLRIVMYRKVDFRIDTVSPCRNYFLKLEVQRPCRPIRVGACHWQKHWNKLVNYEVGNLPSALVHNKILDRSLAFLKPFVFELACRKQDERGNTSETEREKRIQSRSNRENCPVGRHSVIQASLITVVNILKFKRTLPAAIEA